ncbi:ABC-2 family transporter protein [Clostridium tepidiprofundi DSM 19306]|uniref:ABC-2 family transporter protein n=1 Tax=Clostridium tepidiprofundi DSM 19306 TaxID=1121338 RepID=A0A151AU89_9CLOT|nr:hypothetical protein [Clostridium tepidiprofundi]KYH31142.1 ABC-2 family transporter protein [Clostridium tepidiprofundi DSM 19306]
MNLLMAIKRQVTRSKAIFIFLCILLMALFTYYSEIKWNYGAPTYFIRSAYENTFIQSLDSRYIVIILSIVGPIFISFAFSDIYIEDLNSQSISMLFTRDNKRKYHRNNILAIFILSFLILFIPLMINFILCLITYPVVGLDNSTATPAFIIHYDKNNILDIIRILHPSIYIIIRSAIPSLIFALFACITYCISLVIKANKYLCCFLSYSIYIGYNLILNKLNMSKYSFYSYINTASKNGDIFILVCILLILVIFIVTMYFIGVNKKDEVM